MGSKLMVFSFVILAILGFIGSIVKPVLALAIFLAPYLAGAMFVGFILNWFGI